MIEYVLLIISSILVIYGARTLIFLHVAWRHHSEFAQNAHRQSAISELNSTERDNESRIVIFNSDIARQDDYLLLSSSEENRQLNDTNIGRKNIQLTSDLSEFSNSHSYQQVVSIIIATNNEEGVVEELLKSLEALKYSRELFEIIVVDDSTDSTTKILEEWTNRITNLRLIRRAQRIGSKGAALNLAIEYVRKDSSWSFIIDADTILSPDIIERFLFLTNAGNDGWEAIQGYCISYNNSAGSANWVSKGVELRLAQRNLTEFVAKNKLGLPVQITGDLFMIKTSTLKEIGFSTDISEDWDLTLSLHLKSQASKLHKANILFNENLNASNQAPTSFSSYFKQRIRVSEGHTRGFIRMLPKLVLTKQPLKNKMEICFTGFRYLLSILILCTLLLDAIAFSLPRSNVFEIYVSVSLLMQFFCILSVILANVLGFIICSKSKQYGLTYLASKLVVEICTVPALIIGSMLGIFRKKGNFYRTLRISTSHKKLITSLPLTTKKNEPEKVS